MTQNGAPRTLLYSLALAVALTTIASAAPKKELEVGKKGPTFTLPGVDGKKYALEDLLKKHKAVVVTFTCNHCPVAIAYQDRLIALQKDYKDKGVIVAAINSNDEQIAAGDSFEKMKERAKEKKYNFPYLRDKSQEVARAYGALVTPHIFLLNSEGTLLYRGAIDDNNNPKRASKHYLRDAIDAVLAGKDVENTTTKARGCTIKWSRK